MTDALTRIKSKLAEVEAREKAVLCVDKIQFLFGRLNRINHDIHVPGLLSRECAELRQIIRTHEDNRVESPKLRKAVELAVNRLQEHHDGCFVLRCADCVGFMKAKEEIAEILDEKI